MSDRLRVVLAGCGGMSSTWLKTARERPELDLVGLVDIRLEAAEKRREEFDFPAARVSTDLDALLTDLKPDIVFDCTIPESHTEIALTALRHGCHVLGEKPLASSMENAVRAVEAATAAGRLYAVMQNRRYDSRIRGYKNLVQSGEIGPLTTLNSDFYIGAHFGGFRDRMEHVLLLDMAIHSFDQARLISGADPVAVYCREWNPAGSWYDHDASAVAIFEMTGGIVYTYRGSWCAEGLNTSWECEWRAVGTCGSAIWNRHDAMRAQSVKAASGFHSELQDRSIGPEVNGKQGGHVGCIHEFLDCVKTGRQPETICTDNIKSLAMVFGAIESSRSQQRVRIELPAVGQSPTIQ